MKIILNIGFEIRTKSLEYNVAVFLKHPVLFECTKFEVFEDDAECNCTEIVQARYFRVFWVISDWLQRSVHRVYEYGLPFIGGDQRLKRIVVAIV